MTTVSIIVVARNQDEAERCLNRCKELQRYTICVKDVIAYYGTNPSYNRNMAVRLSDSDLLAFIDADAYPSPFWITKSLRHFKDPTVGAVTGAGITPLDEPFLQKISGNVMENLLVSTTARHRYLAPEDMTETFEVDEAASCNLIMRRTLFNSIGGFDERYFPGEDSIISLQLRARGYKIIYDPQVYVWHSRRPIIIPHLRQVWTYARQRGFFVKKFPMWFCSFKYFMPSVALVAWITAAFFAWDGALYLLKLYLVAVFLTAIMEDWKRSLFVIAMIPLTHLTYALGFVAGLLKGDKNV